MLDSSRFARWGSARIVPESAPFVPSLLAQESASRRSAMLALSRKPGEKVVIGNGITLTVVEVRGNRGRLALHCPGLLRILRAELACRQDESLDADPDGRPG